MADQEQSEKTKVRSAGLEDQASSVDLLGFGPYVDAIFNFLVHKDTKPPFTLSIEGDWGSGKSSFMLQLQNKLKKNGAIVINFNAWRHDKVETMWAAFALTFIRQLERSRFWLLSVAFNIIIFFHRFDFRRGWIDALFKATIVLLYAWLAIAFFRRGGLTLIQCYLFTDHGKVDGIDLLKIINSLGFIGLILGALYFLRKVGDVLGNPLAIDIKKYVNKPNYEPYTSFIDHFHLDFEKVVKTFSWRKDKVYVFIDDLDRAEIPKAAELMQGLNLMVSESPKVVFIIGMDREKVVAGIAAKHETLIRTLAKDNLEFGNSFLQKFIQLSFRIPSPTGRELKSFIKLISNPRAAGKQEETDANQTHSVWLEDGEDADEFKKTVELVAPYFHSNPRSIKQFITAFRLKCHIAFNTSLFLVSDEEPFTIPQVGKFVAMSMIWPKIINDLEINHELVTDVLSVDKPDNPLTEKWRLNEKFLSLVKLSPVPYDSDYEMCGVNFKRLLQISPAMVLSKNAALDKGDSDDSGDQEPPLPPEPPYNPTGNTPTSGSTRTFSSSFDSTFG